MQSPTFAKVGDFHLKPIAFIHSSYPDKFGIPRQSGLVPNVISEINFIPEIQPEMSLQGLEGFSHIWLIFIFHQNASQRFHAKVHPPRLEGDTMGLFATRSPHRPNPIGLSLVELLEVKKKSIIVLGADLVDQTPILDIKPYLPQFESKSKARSGWSQHVQKDPIEVVFSEKALEDLKEWKLKFNRENLELIIADHLKLDPRPNAYKGYEDQEKSPYRNQHSFRLYEGDIHFEFYEKNRVRVINISF